MAIAGVVALSLPAFAQTPPATTTVEPPPAMPALETAEAAPDDRVDRLARELSDLRRQLDEERQARKAAVDALAAAAAKRAESSAAPPARAMAMANSAPSAATMLGSLHATVGGFVQADAVAYRQDSEDQLDGATGTPLNQTRFLIRRAHLRADAEWRFLSGVLELEASTVDEPSVRLFDAEVTARWANPDASMPPYVALSVGLLRIPFGFENQERDYTRLFLERSAVIRALFPGENDLGIRLHGGWRLFRYQLAAMNGHPLGEAGFPALDPTAHKDILGRLGIDTLLARAVTLQAGLSGLYGTGFHAGTPATKDTLVWRDENGDGVVQLSEVQAIQGLAAIPSQSFERYAVGADLRLTARLPRVGELCLYGELVWAANLDRSLLVADPVSVGRDLRELGWYVGATQEITRYALVGVRYDRYNPDADAAEQQGAARAPVDPSYSTLAVVVAAQYPPWGRFTVEYDHNTNALGRTTGGLPTTLAADVLTFRAQLVF